MHLLVIDPALGAAITNVPDLALRDIVDPDKVGWVTSTSLAHYLQMRAQAKKPRHTSWSYVGLPQSRGPGDIEVWLAGREFPPPHVRLLAEREVRGE